MTAQRFDLVIRLGARDADKVDGPQGVWARRELNFVSGARQLGFGVGRCLLDASRLGLAPPETAVDLLLLAAAVHAADTRISRSRHSQDGWTREIRLSLPVEDPSIWSANAALLQRTLRFLTGDIWSLSFRPRPDRFERMALKPNIRASQQLDHDSACLFSGGLDSLIGAIDLMSDGKKPLLVSHAGEGATSKSQEECHRALRVAYPAIRHTRLRAWIQFGKDLIEDGGQEDSTRGRSFLFFALGVLASSGLAPDGSRLLVPENGFISLNSPLEPLRVGSLSTRTTHPFYMARWSEIVVGIGIGCAIENPYQFSTKGEMVEACADQALLRRTIPKSMSCSSPAKARWSGGAAIQHCGYCVPCLIRRAAIVKALGSDPTTYTIAKLDAGVLDTQKAEGEQVRAFQYALKRLADNPSFSHAAVLMTGPLSDVQVSIPDLVSLYERGLAEVGICLRGVKASPG